ncbi:hypothetical protein [Kocuria oceani]|uniref:Uncharacterized protein n=1 Tax=Kocuria oceani TaxID=988827 RepID=A0ABV9TIK8_9MICC|nr:hypothetical protein [Kocuria oceani]
MLNLTTFGGNRIHFHEVTKDISDAALMKANMASIASIMDVTEADLLSGYQGTDAPIGDRLGQAA